MSLKRKKIDTSIERLIITGMIVSDRFLKEVIVIYDADYFELKYANTVASWCIRHFKKYHVAPREVIEDIFVSWEKGNKNQEESLYIKEFLTHVSDEYERADKFNDDYVLDKTVAYFKSRSLKLLSEDISVCIDNNDIQEAEKCLNTFKKVEKVLSEGIEVFEDEEAWRSAFDNSVEVLFEVPGKLGKMLNEQFTRESLVALMGVAKIGKTWNLQFLADCAIRARCNVAFFQAGDLTQGQMLVRQGISIARRSNKPKYCKEMLIPLLDCKHNQCDSCEYPRRRMGRVSLLDTDNGIMEFDEAERIGYKPCIECEDEKWFKGAVWYTRRCPVRPLVWQEAFREIQAYKRKYKAKRFKLSTHPNKSLTVSKIEAILDTWERVDGFIADVIIIDYADIMAPDNKHHKEGRDGIDEIWAALSSLRQKRRCCVITATQANGAAINQKTVGREHYSNDRRKYDHVTAMYGLSQTAEEKRKGITRWGAIVQREDDWDVDFQVNVLGCLQIGKPYISSF